MPTYDVEATYAKVFSKIGLLSVNGRRNRLPFFAVNFVVNFICQICIWLISPINTFTNIFFYIGLLCVYLSFVNLAKRFHDLNKPTYWAGIVFVQFVVSFISGFTGDDSGLDGLMTIVNIVLGIYATFWKGTTGSNFYGPDPLDKQ